MYVRAGIEIRMGIEMDANGRRLAYHVFTRHPSEGLGRERTHVPAAEIIHFFVRYRPGQTRGYSLFAPVLTTLKMVDGLTDAELVASRLAAAKMGFIKNISPEAVAVVPNADR
ncbi:MAG: phage portal protein [Gemmatimonadetes bacterium]|nr:phage portal protein [Gemmatimonadota bacterium]